MLTRLVINDVVLIEKLVLDLAPGLNVFTGETGAGKSILLDALGLALGDRSDASLIRTGASQASVTAEFDLPKKHAARMFAEHQGLVADDDLFVLRRVIAKDGKTKAFLNDQTIGVGLLKQIGEHLLEIHGQFETHGLLNAATHRGLLDTFGGLEPFKADLGTAYEHWHIAEERQRNATTDRHRAAAEEEFLRAAVHELDNLMPEPDEATRLAEQRIALQYREKIVEALATTAQALNGDRGANASLAQAGKTLARIVDKSADLTDILAAVDRAINETAEATTTVERYISGLEADPHALNRIEERLFALRAAARKHNVQVDALPDLRRDLTERLNLLSDKGGELSTLAKAAREARHVYKQLADELADKRRKAAYRLEKAVHLELPPLKLERAIFKIELSPLPEDQWSAEGTERVTFAAATNPGTPTGSLQKIASGGELARFMLALKVVLTANDPVPTLVFDEVDTGIGGATASAVGDRLAALAENEQILVVTHSPQVAARGSHHLRVAKNISGKIATTTVEALDDIDRREEIARMLSGTHVTDAAREAAASLIAGTPPATATMRKVATARAAS